MRGFWIENQEGEGGGTRGGEEGSERKEREGAKGFLGASMFHRNDDK